MSNPEARRPTCLDLAKRIQHLRLNRELPLSDEEGRGFLLKQALVVGRRQPPVGSPVLSSRSIRL